jgi:hypothetical protein
MIRLFQNEKNQIFYKHPVKNRGTRLKKYVFREITPFNLGGTKHKIHKYDISQDQ